MQRRRTHRRRGISRAALLLTLMLASGAAVAGIMQYRQVCCSLPPVPPLREKLSGPRPADFGLTLSASTGTVAPEFYYSYRLAIAPDGAGRVTVTRGYGTDGPQTSADFLVPAGSLDSLWQEFDANRLAETPDVGPIPQDEIRVGGGSSTLSVTAAGQTIQLDDVRRIGDAWEPRVRALIARVEAQLPDSARRAAGMRP